VYQLLDQTLLAVEAVDPKFRTVQVVLVVLVEVDLELHLLVVQELQELLTLEVEVEQVHGSLVLVELQVVLEVKVSLYSDIHLHNDKYLKSTNN
jgi:hypothetical protein